MKVRCRHQERKDEQASPLAIRRKRLRALTKLGEKVLLNPKEREEQRQVGEGPVPPQTRRSQ